MRVCTAFGLVLIATATAGCHESLGLVGDARLDTTTDTVDGITDAVVDPTTEPGTPDMRPDGGIDVVPACPGPNPAPDGPHPYFEIDGYSWPPGSGEIFASCIVDGVASGDDNSYTIYLMNMESGEPHTVYVRADVPIWLDLVVGEPVELWYIWSDGWFDQHRWFVLRYVWGGLIVGGGEGRELPVVPDDILLAPLEVEVFEGECELERDECGTFERTGFRVELYSEVRRFHDRTHGTIGSMESAQVLVGRSFVYHDMECDDFPDRYTSGLVFMVPEG